MTSTVLRHQQGSILFLGFDTPNSTINVMTRSTASELIEIFDALRPQDTKLVVFWSRKPYSFLNGAELILTQNIHSEQDLLRLTQVTREAYKKVASSTIPTVAAIEGNCFGCGMEFVLCCDYRVASASYDTRFYMTELSDYHLLPIFGGLERLPKLVGIKPAIDLLIRGFVWDSKMAMDYCLVDQVLPMENFSEELNLFLQRLLQAGASKRSPKANTALEHFLGESPVECYQRVQKELECLAPEKQSLYRECLNLLFREFPEEGQWRQIKDYSISRAMESITSQASKYATSFFFIRSMAKMVSLGTTTTIPPKEVIIEAPIGEPFGQVLCRNKIRGLTVHQTTSEAPLYLLRDRDGNGHPFQVEWGFQKDTQWQQERTLIHFPLQARGDLAEAFIEPQEVKAFKPFFILLSHLGWQVLPLPSGKLSPVCLMVDCYMQFLKEIRIQGKKIENLNRSLWSFGFDLLPADVVKGFPNYDFRDQELTRVMGVEEPSLLNEFLIALYQKGNDLLASGVLRHSSQLDVIIRSVFGYPIIRENFSRFVSKRVQRIQTPQAAVLSGGRN